MEYVTTTIITHMNQSLGIGKGSLGNMRCLTLGYFPIPFLGKNVTTYLRNCIYTIVTLWLSAAYFGNEGYDLSGKKPLANSTDSKVNQYWWLLKKSEVHFERESYLAKPTPLLSPLLLSLSILVLITLPKSDNMLSKSFSSIFFGRLEMYKFVGSCSCCCREKKRQEFEW